MYEIVSSDTIRKLTTAKRLLRVFTGLKDCIPCFMNKYYKKRIFDKLSGKYTTTIITTRLVLNLARIFFYFKSMIYRCFHSLQNNSVYSPTRPSAAALQTCKVAGFSSSFSKPSISLPQMSDRQKTYIMTVPSVIIKIELIFSG